MSYIKSKTKHIDYIDDNEDPFGSTYYHCDDCQIPIDYNKKDMQYLYKNHILSTKIEDNKPYKFIKFGIATYVFYNIIKCIIK